MLLFHAMVTLVIVATCGVAWAVMGNQKADAQLVGEESNPFTLEQVEPGAYVNVWIEKGPNADEEWSPNIKYALGGYPLYPYLDYELGKRVELGYEIKLTFSGFNPNGFSEDEDNYCVLKCQVTQGNPNIVANGNIMSLLNPDCTIKDIPNDYCFTNLFEGFKILTKAPLLPATNLSNYCYSEMFSGCKELKVGPDLPAKSLASGCYSSMFDGCTALETMSVSFTSWGSADTTLNWLDGVQAKGTFICPLELYIDRGASKIPMQWDVKRLKTLDNHIISINTAVFPYDGSEKHIDVTAKYGEKDYTSQLVVQGTTSAVSPGIYTYKVILDPTPTSNADEIVPAGEYTGQWCIYGPNGPSPTPDPGGGGSSGDISGTGTAQTGDVPLYVGIALLLILAIHGGAYLYWRRTPKNAKHL